MKKEHELDRGILFILVAALTGAAAGCVGGPSLDEQAGAASSSSRAYAVSQAVPLTVDLASDFGLVSGSTQVFELTMLSAPGSKNDTFVLSGTTYTDRYGVLNNNLDTPEYRVISRGPGFSCTADSDECWRHHAALAVQVDNPQITVTVAGAAGVEGTQRRVLVRLLPNGNPLGVAELDLSACTDIPAGSQFDLWMYDVDFAQDGEAPLGGSFAHETRWSLPRDRHLQNIYLDQLWGQDGTTYRVKIMSADWTSTIGFFDLVLRPGDVNYPCANGVPNVFTSSFIDGDNRY